MIFSVFSWVLDKITGPNGLAWMAGCIAVFLWFANGKLERKIHALEQQKTEAEHRIQTLEEAAKHAQNAARKTVQVFREQRKVERMDHSDDALYSWLQQQSILDQNTHRI